jgi:small-conductance mechanosensitive channel
MASSKEAYERDQSSMLRIISKIFLDDVKPLHTVDVSPPVACPPGYGLWLCVLFSLFAIQFQSVPAIAAAMKSSPLKPPETDSPRATLFGFKSAMKEVYQLAMERYGSGTVYALQRATRYLDLSKLPPRLAKDKAIEAALLLKEVLDRLDLPSIEQVPGNQSTPDGNDARSKDEAIASTPTGGTAWRVPGTEIKIKLIDNGPRAGEFLFSSETVQRLKDYYARVSDLPYKTTATPGLYRIYISTPGHGVQMKWGRWLPDWSKHIIVEQTVWQWLATFITIIFSSLISVCSLLVTRRLDWARSGESENRPEWQRTTVRIIGVAAAAGIVCVADWFITEIINLTGTPLETVTYVLAFFEYLLLCWLIVLIVLKLTDMMICLRGLTSDVATGRLFHLAGLGLCAFVVLGAIVHAGQAFNLHTYSIITGLGVGGIAVGLGAQTLVRDVLSGIFFVVDDAFRLGEYIDTGETTGTVEKISIRSLQLRHHNGPLNTIPFGEIKHITNFSRDWIMMKLPFRVPFNTDIERLRKLIEKLGVELLEDPMIGHTFVEPLKSQGTFQIDDFGIVIRVKFATLPGEQFLARPVIYQRIQELFKEEGIEFAGREVKVKPSPEDDKGLSPSPEAKAIAIEIADEDPTKITQRNEVR